MTYLEVVLSCVISLMLGFRLGVKVQARKDGKTMAMALGAVPEPEWYQFKARKEYRRKKQEREEQDIQAIADHVVKMAEQERKGTGGYA